MDHTSYSDDYLRGILQKTKVIALVGASPKPDRPSHGVMAYLQAKGYKVIPVNPGIAGQMLLGERVYASLGEISEWIDMVDVFRASDAVPGIVDEALAAGARIIWTQLGVRHDEALARAEAQGIQVVMDRCTKIEYGRLMG